MIGLVSSRVGEISANTKGTLMKIVEYNTSYDMTVEFQDENKFQVRTTYSNFKTGCISNPYDKTLYNMACLGNGKYKAKENGKTTYIYCIWNNMISRCYKDTQKDKYPAYYGICTVCDEWLNHQNFAEWYDENSYTIPDERVELDKDILNPGNKIYSPKNCIIVPQSINLLFSRHNNKKDKACPPGIRREKSGEFTVYLTYKGQGEWHGKIPSLEKACEIYKSQKKKHIIQAAEDYKQYIPQKLYDALYNYEVKCEPFT